MTVTFSLSVYERRNPRNVVECIYLVGRGKGASAHSQLEWALTALVEEMGDMKKTQVVFSEQTTSTTTEPMMNRRDTVWSCIGLLQRKNGSKFGMESAAVCPKRRPELNPRRP
jgi:hypothetical protein